MHFFTLRLNENINNSLDKISKDTSISKSNLILFALFTLTNKHDKFDYYYSSDNFIRTGIRLPIRLNKILDNKVSELATSKNLYINSLLREFINSFEYI
ncbi:hypothetical protein [Streptobacillus moniliformis]|uniref:hypothetical protein n=1 Tax=Streptobacillus moniliformis TaxID=34105 RepID=UPI0007E3F94E|nr:hypothetical protein [Streptobacillus moniliformis]